MKNYVAKLRENQEKGFSLVELIIVMAIMAILVGVVASQVIPYMEKSRQSKDQQVVSALLTDINSAIAQSGEACAGGTTTVDKLKDVTNAKTETELMELRPGYSSIGALYTALQGQLKSKAFTGSAISVKVDATTGKTTVFIGTSLNTSNSKSYASTDESNP